MTIDGVKVAYEQRGPRAQISKMAAAIRGRTGEPVFDGEVNAIRGFCPMTRITTSFGEMPAAALRKRDQIKTRSGQYLPILWLDRITLDRDFLARHKTALPVLIRAGALGHRLPAADIMLAPQQRFSPRQQFHGAMPATAGAAVGRPSVVRKAETSMIYTVFHCGQPVSVCAEGVWLEVEG